MTETVRLTPWFPDDDGHHSPSVVFTQKRVINLPLFTGVRNRPPRDADHDDKAQQRHQNHHGGQQQNIQQQFQRQQDQQQRQQQQLQQRHRYLQRPWPQKPLSSPFSKNASFFNNNNRRMSNNANSNSDPGIKNVTGNNPANTSTSAGGNTNNYTGTSDPVVIDLHEDSFVTFSVGNLERRNFSLLGMPKLSRDINRAEFGSPTRPRARPRSPPPGFSLIRGKTRTRLGMGMMTAGWRRWLRRNDRDRNRDDSDGDNGGDAGAKNRKKDNGRRNERGDQEGEGSGEEEVKYGIVLEGMRKDSDTGKTIVTTPTTASTTTTTTTTNTANTTSTTVHSGEGENDDYKKEKKDYGKLYNSRSEKDGDKGEDLSTEREMDSTSTLEREKERASDILLAPVRRCFQH